MDCLAAPSRPASGVEPLFGREMDFPGQCVRREGRPQGQCRQAHHVSVFDGASSKS
jgi:hypothetical protein